MSIILKEDDIRSAIRKTLQNERFNLVVTGGGRRGVKSKGIGDTPVSLGSTSIKDNVKWGSGKEARIRKIAWSVLSYFLPSGTVLTSCFREQSDQDRIIRNKAKKHNYSGPDNLNSMLKFVRSKGEVVARRPGKGHGGAAGTGAFDLSGADLDLIWEGVLSANNDKLGAVKFKGLNAGSIIERVNNAVHVEFSLRDIDLKKCEQFLQEESPSQKGDKPEKIIPSAVDKITPKAKVTIKHAKGQSFPGKRYVVSMGGKNTTLIKIDSGRDQVVFKRIKSGPPTFGGNDPTFKRLGDKEAENILPRLA